MASAEQVGGSAEVSTLLAVCIRDSLESAFQWHIEQTAKDADNDAVRVCLLAKATVNLLGIEVTTFSPALVPYLPIAADVAAKALHELYGSQLLPWLATGTRAHSCCVYFRLCAQDSTYWQFASLFLCSRAPQSRHSKASHVHMLLACTCTAQSHLASTCLFLWQLSTAILRVKGKQSYVSLGMPMLLALTHSFSRTLVASSVLG